MSTLIRSSDECLELLGAVEPTREERESLDESGFVVLRRVLTSAQAAAMAERLDALAEREGGAAGSELGMENATEFLCNLFEKDPIFDACLTNPRVLGAVAHVLAGDVKLFSMNARSPRRNEGHQGLHADWSEPIAPGDYKICNSIWMLDDFTEENGATRIVPGTHRQGLRAQDVLDDPEAAHPDELRVTGQAGTVAVFNSHVWHGGTTNETDKPRHAITTAYCRRDQHQQYDFDLSEATLARLGAAARYLIAADD